MCKAPPELTGKEDTQIIYDNNFESYSDGDNTSSSIVLVY